jgi:hypothetical protein
METAIINGVKCALPCKAVSIGLNMQCHHVVTKSVILSVNEAEDMVIIDSEGIKIRLRMKDLDGFYADTKENRDKLAAQCRKEYLEWKEAVRKQMEACSRRN